MTKNKEPVIEAVTIRCPYCKEIVEITEGLISPEYTCSGTIPIYIEDGKVQLDWSSIDIHNITFDYYCPACEQQVADWSETLEALHKKYKKSLARKKEAKNEGNCS